MAKTAAMNGHDPKKHGNVAQIVTAIIAGLALVISGVNLYSQLSSHSSENQAKALDEHVGTLINTQLQPVTERLSKLEGQVQELTTEVHNLANTILQRLTPNASMTTSQINERFEQIPRFVTAAFTANLAGDPAKTESVRNDIQAVLKSKRLQPSTMQAGISAAVYVEGYRAFSRAVNAGMAGISLSGITLSGPEGTPLEKHFFTGIQALNEQEARAVYNIHIKDLWQDLKYIPWLNVEFIHDKIMYDGEDLFLANAQFENCDFVPVITGNPKKDERAKEVLARLRKVNNGPPISALVANDQVFFP